MSHFPKCKVLDYRVHALVFTLNDIGESVDAYFVNEKFAIVMIACGMEHECVEFIL
jgi:hypothetical protein